jgi:hypothetical protein
VVEKLLLDGRLVLLKQGRAFLLRGCFHREDSARTSVGNSSNSLPTGRQLGGLFDELARAQRVGSVTLPGTP